MKITYKKLLPILAILIFITILLLPIYLYFKNFYSGVFSNTPSDWGVFGDYIGGILNTIIGLFSFIVLTYLTYIVSQQSIEHNKKLSLLQRKLDAYDGLIKQIKEINSIPDQLQMFNLNHLINAKFPEQDAIKDAIEKVKEYASISTIYANFHQTLYNFRVRYSPIFVYSFNCDDYLSLLTSSSNLKDLYIDITKHALDKNEPDVITKTLIAGTEFAEILSRVVNSLKNEIEDNIK